MSNYKTMTPRQLMTFLQISKSTYTRRINAGLIPKPHKIGGIKLYDEQEIMSWYDTQLEISREQRAV